MPAPRASDFRLIAGSPSLDLVNTIDWAWGGPTNEQLAMYADLTAFATQTGVLEPATAEALDTVARGAARKAAAALERARELRAAIREAALAVVDARQPEAGSLATVNAAVRESLAHVELVPDGTRYKLSWRELDRTLTAPLWPIAWSAARLLASAEATQIRVCPGEDCGWLFVDRSRNGMRRWCEMETCGNRAKARRRTSRQRRR